MKQLQTSLATDRLTLRPLEVDDDEFIKELVNTEGWLKFIGDRNVHSNQDARVYIQNIISNPEVIYWVVRPKRQNDPIGIITLIKRKELACPDIGFAFLPAVAKNGYAFETANTVLQYVLTTGDIAFLNAITNKENLVSVQLLKRLGFEFIEEKITPTGIDQLYGAGADKILISLLVQSFFSVFTNAHGHPRLDTLNEICLQEALIISKQSAGTNVMTLATFIAPREKLLTEGTLLGFEEKEISGDTKIVGDIAQHYSKYKKKGVLNGDLFETHGHKFFQLIKLDGAWKISAVVWTDE
jgi:RimJ/RimL family protein N-acetyltransferase